MITKISTETKLYKSLISDAIRRESWDNMPTKVCVKTGKYHRIAYATDSEAWSACMSNSFQTVSDSVRGRWIYEMIRALWVHIKTLLPVAHILNTHGFEDGVFYF